MLRSKTCFKCEVKKEISEFYKHGQMSDGYMGKCKECTKSYVAEHRANNLERIREYDRKRGKLPHRVALTVEVTRNWRKMDKRRVVCHSAVARALRNGSLIPEDCEVCKSEKTVAHHDCYDKPLEVRWLCQSCHKQWHRDNDYT